MIEKTYTINAYGGLHARPISQLVKTTRDYSAEITLRYGDKQADAKSAIAIMSLAIPQGAHFTLVYNGVDEEQAVLGVEQFLQAIGMIT